MHSCTVHGHLAIAAACNATIVFLIPNLVVTARFVCFWRMKVTVFSECPTTDNCLFFLILLFAISCSQVFDANTDATTLATNQFPRPVLARVVRITCVERAAGSSSWNLRFELLGCKIN